MCIRLQPLCRRTTLPNWHYMQAFWLRSKVRHNNNNNQEAIRPWAAANQGQQELSTQYRDIHHGYHNYHTAAVAATTPPYHDHIYLKPLAPWSGAGPGHSVCGWPARLGARLLLFLHTGMQPSCGCEYLQLATCAHIFHTSTLLVRLSK